MITLDLYIVYNTTIFQKHESFESFHISYIIIMCMQKEISVFLPIMSFYIQWTAVQKLVRYDS
jgi:hypothetical protein